MQTRHLQNLITLQKDKTFDYSGRTNGGEGRFTAGECPLFLTSSGFYGNVKGNAKFDWAAAPMPYYPDVPGAPQNSIIGGASLWVMGGKKPGRVQGRRQILRFPVRRRPPGAPAPGVRLPPDHARGLRKNQGVGLLPEESLARSRVDRTDQQRADGEFARASLRQHGAVARHLGGGDRGGARRSETRQGGAWTAPSSAATRSCVSSSAKRRDRRSAVASSAWALRPERGPGLKRPEQAAGRSTPSWRARQRSRNKSTHASPPR